MENKLSQLQKVGAELVTDSGHRSRGIAGALSTHETDITEVKCFEDRPNSN